MRKQIRQIGLAITLLAAPGLAILTQGAAVKTAGHAVIVGAKDTGRETGKMTARAAGGAEHLTRRVVVDTGKGVGKGTKDAAKEVEHAAVHGSEQGGRKMIGLLKRI